MRSVCVCKYIICIRRKRFDRRLFRLCTRMDRKEENPIISAIDVSNKNNNAKNDMICTAAAALAVLCACIS